MKIIRRIVLLVILLLIIGGVVAYVSVDRIIKSTVQTEATHSLNLNTTLDSAHLSLFGGSLRLDGLNVASPAGFSSDPMFSVGQAAMSVHYSQLHRGTIHIANVTITNPKLLVEYANHNVNLNAAMKGMPKSGESSSKSTGGGNASASDNSQPIKLIIDTLTITGPTVTVRPGKDIPGISGDVNIPLGDITVSNIGNGDGAQNGAAIKEVVTTVMNQMYQQAIKSGKLQGAVKDALLKNVGGEFGGVINDATQNPAQLGNDIGNLLGGKKH